MHSLQTIKKQNDKILAFDAKSILECSADCSTRCCLNCDNFITAVVNEAQPSQLFKVCCSRIPDTFDTWSGLNECEEFTPR